MKILLDTCAAKSAIHILIAAGFDVIHAGNWPADPGDEEILAFAFRNKMILVTLDKDFGRLVVMLNQPCRGIIRLVEVPSEKQGSLILQILKDYENILRSGGIITASTQRVRVRSSKGIL